MLYITPPSHIFKSSYFPQKALKLNGIDCGGDKRVDTDDVNVGSPRSRPSASADDSLCAIDTTSKRSRLCLHPMGCWSSLLDGQVPAALALESKNILLPSTKSDTGAVRGRGVGVAVMPSAATQAWLSKCAGKSPPIPAANYSSLHHSSNNDNAIVLESCPVCRYIVPMMFYCVRNIMF